jgi:hypothetical protein
MHLQSADWYSSQEYIFPYIILINFFLCIKKTPVFENTKQTLRYINPLQKRTVYNSLFTFCDDKAKKKKKINL